MTTTVPLAVAFTPGVIPGNAYAGPVIFTATIGSSGTVQFDINMMLNLMSVAGNIQVTLSGPGGFTHNQVMTGGGIANFNYISGSLPAGTYTLMFALMPGSAGTMSFMSSTPAINATGQSSQVVCGGDHYRYGFNGQEKDNELKGVGNSLDFGARIYDTRLGRWLSTDPLQEDYVGLSPYNYVANSPLRFIDPDGKKIYIYYNTGEKDESGKPVYKAYEYGSGLKAPRDRFVRKTIRTINRLKRNDPIGMINKLQNDQEYNVAVFESKNWNASSITIQVGGATILDYNTGQPIDENSVVDGPDAILWNPHSGLISPDGKQRQSAASALLHEFGHSYYAAADPEGKNAEYFGITDDALRSAYDEKERKEAGEFHTYSDKWIIENIEGNIKGEWKRENHGAGYFLKTRGGTFSTRGTTYGRWGKEGKVRDLKKGNAISKSEKEE